MINSIQNTRLVLSVTIVLIKSSLTKEITPDSDQSLRYVEEAS